MFAHTQAELNLKKTVLLMTSIYYLVYIQILNLEFYCEASLYCWNLCLSLMCSLIR